MSACSKRSNKTRFKVWVHFHINILKVPLLFSEYFVKIVALCDLHLICKLRATKQGKVPLTLCKVPWWNDKYLFKMEKGKWRAAWTRVIVEKCHFEIKGLFSTLVSAHFIGFNITSDTQLWAFTCKNAHTYRQNPKHNNGNITTWLRLGNSIYCSNNNCIEVTSYQSRNQLNYLHYYELTKLSPEEEHNVCNRYAGSFLVVIHVKFMLGLSLNITTQHP